MYPKNAATPPEIDLGQMLLIADGTVQTSGASVRVKIGTGSWGVGAGTASCDITSGIWTYAPTQGETNSTYFIVALYKTNCFSLSKTVITTASAIAGKASIGDIDTDAITATAVKADAVTKIQAGLSTYAGGDTAGTGTLLSRLTSTRAGYLDGLSNGIPTAAQNAAAVDVALVNTGDGTDLLQAIANQIAADWVAGDASPLAVAAAVRTNLTTELARIDVAISTRNATTPPTVAAIRAEMDSNSTQLAKLGTPASSISADIAATKVDTAATLVEVGKIPRKLTAIAAGAAATKTNSSVTPNQSITETIT